MQAGHARQAGADRNPDEREVGCDLRLPASRAAYGGALNGLGIFVALVAFVAGT